ncbi:MAG TPA: hypothetical protein VFS34_09505 [Thermoanaerobaculia bacterium]|nr:hypothetical protein [Thermoanaerobaculia bacterium]
MRPTLEGRRRLAIVCVLVVLAAEAASLRAGEIRGRWGAFGAFFAKSPEDARLGGSSFAFNRRLGPFLRGVESATPADATIALTFATDEGDPATYAAAYVLAPRRVVGPGRQREADFAALFGAGGSLDRHSARSTGPSGAVAVPFGELARRR